MAAGSDVVCDCIPSEGRHFDALPACSGQVKKKKKERDLYKHI